MYGYIIDVVLCIDATNGMQPFIKMLQENAHKFYEQVMEAIDAESMSCDMLRVKVIVFKDFICDTNPMVESRFFTLPEDNTEFKNFVNKIEPTGGGDTPENSLEALALAVKSDWTEQGGRFRRHVVLMFTDAPALPLQERKNCPGYPTGMPKDLAELGDWWEGQDQYFDGSYSPKAGRLVVFAPDVQPWSDIQSWNRYWYKEVVANAGINVDMQEVIDLLVGSI